ncbi:hypothetical protein [Agromyces sp. Soil535]|uniref:hypothetical protein n=1 Tax=Agromyces sp. Soil535 TaxID=1736390 RepID=UPI0012E38079|nr:hypothetical protein [Agromyces sp. Soil535]
MTASQPDAGDRRGIPLAFAPYVALLLLHLAMLAAHLGAQGLIALGVVRDNRTAVSPAASAATASIPA